MYRSNKISRLFGKFAHKKFNKSIQHIINKSYVNIFKINLNEFKDYTQYETLNDLFTRELVKPREIQTKSFNIISPTDSLIMESGNINKNTALQIKGKSYNALELLYGYGAEYRQIEKNESQARLDSYSYINLYLSPKDYHHYHAPCDLEVLEARYFSGTLLPVNKNSLLKNNNLFIHNERVVLTTRLKYNASIAYFVAIGALNVGKICFDFDHRIQTNAQLGDAKYIYENPIQLKAGDKIGYFEMGSTVVLIIKAHWSVHTNDIVKMGQEIGTLPAM
ncbi:phosphatidylserine decarboxylase [Helicobacter muridarum]|uniref:phosphatidylserine decarboxylase n=1 Tax=Helicobacter muridarum TaxID=216 RepID=A0A377PX39_9HELI|nr:phosphatidylserine decarboxylase [Helicobacter muridarum]TLD99784.1 phosphatidylserine decarboxylase [Helicobacter muridarum]STQ86982.1 phosphatidylserine decarboxylase [Helicobacter muridarum]